MRFSGGGGASIEQAALAVPQLCPCGDSKTEMQPRLPQTVAKPRQFAEAGQRCGGAMKNAALRFERGVEHEVVGIAKVLDQQAGGVAMLTPGRRMGAEGFG